MPGLRAIVPQRGFTLIEWVISLIVLGILAMVGLPILSNSARLQRDPGEPRHFGKVALRH